MHISEFPARYDAAFASRIEGMSWQRSSRGYLRYVWVEGGRERWVSMHRAVWAWTYGWDAVPRYIDHINGDRMDNRLANLRPATLSLNAHNSKNPRRSHDLPRGVSRSRGSKQNPYFSSISHNTQTIYLGVFPTAEAAAAAYRDARSQIMEYEAAIALGKTPEPPRLGAKPMRKGRPPTPGGEEACRLYRRGLSAAAIAKRMGIWRGTVTRMLREGGVQTDRRRKLIDTIVDGDILDTCPSPKKEGSDDSGDSGGERRERPGAADDSVRQADGELLGGLDGEEGRSDDVG